MLEIYFNIVLLEMWKDCCRGHNNYELRIIFRLTFSLSCSIIIVNLRIMGFGMNFKPAYYGNGALS